jgi:putative sterol carrier protein
MTDATKGFFEGLASRHEPLLENTKGTLRFELANGKAKERWLVSIDKGDVSVSHGNSKADCTIRASRALFDDVAAGEVNAMAALLRGAIEVEGDSELLVVFQRLFPGPAADAEAQRRESPAAARRR